MQHAQQLHLQRQRHIADLVEEQRAARCRPEQPFAAADRAGKGALGMAEQFGLQQLLRQRAAVDGDERLAGARAGRVDRLRHHLFTGAALAVDQDADVGLRHHFHLLQQAQHQRAAGDDVFAPGLVAGRGGRQRERLVDGLIQRIAIHRFGEEAEHPCWVAATASGIEPCAVRMITGMPG